MSTRKELCIYHDIVSPLSYASAPSWILSHSERPEEQTKHGDMVRLAFLLTKLRGVWARCRWTVCLCSPPGDVKGNVIANRTWCQLEIRVSVWRRGLPLCWFSWNVECFSSLTVLIFTGFHVKKGISPENPLRNTATTRLECVCLSACLCVCVTVSSLL